MVREMFSFDDELTGYGVEVYVETSNVHDLDESKKGHNGLYLCTVADGWETTSVATYIPRKQAKKIIKAMKAVLNEE